MVEDRLHPLQNARPSELAAVAADHARTRLGIPHRSCRELSRASLYQPDQLPKHRFFAQRFPAQGSPSGSSRRSAAGRLGRVPAPIFASIRSRISKTTKAAIAGSCLARRSDSMSIGRPVVLGWLLLLGAGNIHAAPPATAASTKAGSPAFDRFVDRLAADWMRANPAAATAQQYFSGAEQDALDRELTARGRSVRNAARHRGARRLRRARARGIAGHQRFSPRAVIARTARFPGLARVAARGCAAHRGDGRSTFRVRAVSRTSGRPGEFLESNSSAAQRAGCR